jgi:2-iminoacetate synthase ThiH
MPQLCDDLALVRSYVLTTETAEALIGRASPSTAATLERALSGQRVSVDEAIELLQCEGDDLRALIRTADEIRRRDVGDEVTYVVNRNVNFTNICFVGCQFCAFKRQRWEHDAYDHSIDSILAKIAEAVEQGATEVCMQGGINPDMDPFGYRDLLVAIKRQFPDIHVHAFSPMEIMYGARRAGMAYPEYLKMLKDAGIGSLPGTSSRPRIASECRRPRPSCTGTSSRQPTSPGTSISSARYRRRQAASPSSCPCASST